MVKSKLNLWIQKIQMQTRNHVRAGMVKDLQKQKGHPKEEKFDSICYSVMFQSMTIYFTKELIYELIIGGRLATDGHGMTFCIISSVPPHSNIY